MKQNAVDEQKVTAEDVARGERLLFAVKEAFPHIAEILKTTNTWSADRKTPPPLLKQSYGWKDAVDTETFERFTTLVAFLRDALFGVDCDNDAAVRFRIVDMRREEDFLPHVRVSRVRDRDSLAKRYRQLELAEMNLTGIQSRVNTMKRLIEHELRDLVDKEDRKAKAKDCDSCKGAGWVKTDQATWEALDYGEQCRTQAIGCSVQHGGGKKVYRLFCECQKEEAGDGDD